MRSELRRTRKAADAYRRGFDANLRDAYCGLNAVFLMDLVNAPQDERKALLPVVRYVCESRLTDRAADYWDHDALLVLAVLDNDKNRALQLLPRVLSFAREIWEPEVTNNTLRLIREARERRGESVTWLRKIEKRLEQWKGLGPKGRRRRAAKL